MNYYEHHLGDYAKDTAHLSMIEDGAYRRLLDLCYATEKPLPLEREKLYRLARATTEEEKRAVDIVLGEFFIEGDGGWHHKRVREELKKATARIKAAKTNGKKGGRPKTQRKPSGFNSGNPEESKTEPRSKLPSTTSHLPSTNKEQSAQRSRGSRLPADWKPDEQLLAWEVKERPDLDPAQTLARFRDHWAAAPGSKGLKLDWGATYRNWVRNEKPGGKVVAHGAPPTSMAIGNCPCGAKATVRVGGKPRCEAHVKGYEEAA